MTIQRTNSNWAFGDGCSSAQLNALDTNVTNALDKRSGQTDTLASTVTVTGGLIVSGTQTFAPGSTVNLSGGTFNVNPSTTTDIELIGSSLLSASAGGSVNIGTGGKFTATIGSTTAISGALNIGPVASVNIAGAPLTTAGNVTIQSVAQLRMSGSVSFAPGAQVVSAMTVAGNIQANSGITTATGQPSSFNGSLSMASGADLNLGSDSDLVIGFPSKVKFATNATVGRTHLVGPNILNPSLLGGAATWGSNLTVAGSVIQNSIAAGNTFECNVPELVQGSTLLTITLRYLIPTNHTPGTKMTFNFSRQNTATGAVENLLSGPTALNYTTFGAITTQTFNVVSNGQVDRVNYIYYFYVTGENGTSSATGNVVYSFDVVYSFSDIVAAYR